MTIELSGAQKLLTVRLTGEIDHFRAKMIKKAVEDELLRTGAINIAFDFSGISFMDSSGVGLILGRYKTVKALGGRIVLFGMRPGIERIIRMSGIDKIAEIY